jgi:hypothetical protein
VVSAASPQLAPARRRDGSKRRRQIGPIERAARRVDASDEKRRVLLALAAFADEGIENPSILELSRRCRVHRMAVVVKLDKLARDGVISLRRGRPRERTTYRFLIDTPPDPKGPNPMTTKTDTPEAEKAQTDAPEAQEGAERAVGAREPVTQPPRAWQGEGWLPPKTEGISWPVLDSARERHVAAVEVLAAAREVGDEAAEGEAMVEVCEAVLAAVEDIRASLSHAEADYVRSREALKYPGGGLIPSGEQAAENARVAALRPVIEADVKVIHRAQRIIAADTFEDEGERPLPGVVVEVRRVLKDLR